MSIYYKFLRPGEIDFTREKTRITFTQMLVPPPNDPTEKYCYVEIPEELFENFLEDFGTDGEVLDDRNEFPDNFFDMAKGRHFKFTIIEPRTKTY